MSGNILCIAAAVLAIDAGWQPLPGGGVQYLIQIEPEMLDTLRSGGAIESDIPPQVKNVRAYRITVGRKELPRELPPAATIEAPEKSTAANAWPSPVTGREFDSPSAPNTLPPDPTSRPIVEPAVALTKPAKATPSDKSSSESSPKPAWESTGDSSQQQEASSKPWVPLTLALLVLFASLGGNAYLLWIAADFRRRYRALVQRTQGV